MPKKVVYRKEYELRKVGRGGVETTIPRIVLEREARRRGLSYEEFIERYKIVHLFNDFEDIAAAYRFIPKEEIEEIQIPEID